MIEGEPIIGIWYCRRCGKEYFPNQLKDRVCPECGEELVYDEAT